MNLVNHVVAALQGKRVNRRSAPGSQLSSLWADVTRVLAVIVGLGENNELALGSGKPFSETGLTNNDLIGAVFRSLKKPRWNTLAV